jgi:hypothetical protein
MIHPSDADGSLPKLKIGRQLGCETGASQSSTLPREGTRGGIWRPCRGITGSSHVPPPLPSGRRRRQATNPQTPHAYGHSLAGERLLGACWWRSVFPSARSRRVPRPAPGHPPPSSSWPLVSCRSCEEQGCPGRRLAAPAADPPNPDAGFGISPAPCRPRFVP